MEAATGWARGGSIRGVGVTLSVFLTFAPDPMPLTDPIEKNGRVNLWWGPVVEIHPGDRLRYFSTPVGVAVEEVVPA